jgi:glycosyltransferase involved in cell wall biosynthesis
VSAQKRPAFWIEVAKLAHERNMNFVFEWWGPLSGSLDTDNLVLNNLPPNAFFMGPTEKPEIQLRTADIVFQTSDREAFSLSILEAAVAGIPQIYSDKLELEKSLEKNLYAYENGSPLSALQMLVSIVAAWPEPAKAAIDFSRTAYDSFGIDQATEKYLSWLLKER